MTSCPALCAAAVLALILVGTPAGIGAEAEIPASAPAIAPAEPGAAPDAVPGKPPRVYSVHDLDRDGYLSSDEYRSFEEYFARWKEISGRPKGRRFPLPFEVIDEDGDGLVSEAEMTAAIERHAGPMHRRRGQGM